MYRGCVLSADLIAAAAAQTVAAGTARVFAAWSKGTPVPEETDQRCEGVADFAARRARVWQVPFWTVGLAADFVERYGDGEGDAAALSEPQEMIYDGANAYMHVAGKWTGFFLGDRDKPRTINDPLWPLDALFGAGDAVELGTDAVRDVPATRYRMTIDLAQADAALPAGVTVPAGPYRALSQIRAEVWLDSAGLARRIAVLTDAEVGDDPIWSVVELWDFGVAAEIVPPDDVVPPREAYAHFGEE
jgi:hypothetical protein